MSDIVYYFVPIEHRSYTTKEEQMYKLNSESWTEITVADSNSIYENKNWRERMLIRFFVENTYEVAQLLWEIKNEDEKLLIKKRLYRFRKEYTTIFIGSEDALATTLSELDSKNFEAPFLYTKQGEIEKIVYITGGETLDLLIKNEYVDDVECIIQNWADKVDYLEYEFGEG